MQQIEGKIMSVSNPKEFRIDKKPSNYSSNVSDYYHIVVKENNGNEILIYLSTSSMGISNPQKSVIFFQKGNQWIRTVMVNPRKYFGKKVIVEGEKKNENYMSRVTAFKLVE
jgi:hypothetical protein